MAFHNPDAFWLLFLVPVLAAAGALLGIIRRRDRRRFAEANLYETLSRSVSRVRRSLRTACFFAGLAFLAIAMTEPRFGTRTEIIRRTGVEVVIALDTSFSMLAEDVKPSRIAQAKYEISRLIDNLQGDRVAIVAFSGKSYVQCPLTTDYGAAKMLLEFVDAGIVPVPGTNIGSAIKESLDLIMRGSEAGGESRVIILFTDGENLEGDPADAAKKASDRGIRIFAVGIGTPDGDLIPIRDAAGKLEGYKENRQGEKVKTSLDEITLEKIVSLTGGMYLRERGGEMNVNAIIEQLGSMKKADLNERKISRLKERYQIPLGVSLFFLLAWVTIGDRRREPKSAMKGGGALTP
jgi:Ca-activated chloride channel family protein